MQSPSVDVEMTVIVARPLTLNEAFNLRTLAETSDDSNAYEMAAAAFNALGMFESAARCRDRADYYRRLA